VDVDVGTGEPTPAFALAALLDSPVKVRHVDARPATIEVRDAGVRDHLAEALDGTGTPNIRQLEPHWRMAQAA